MFPTFRPSAERFTFPGEQTSNYLVFKGPIICHTVNNQFPIKIILPLRYPNEAPRIYFDMQLTMNVVQTLNYIGAQNMITIPYMQGWGMNHNLCHLM